MDVNRVTGLVQDLVRKVSSNRETRESVSEKANQVLQAENDRLQLLNKYDLPIVEREREQMPNREGDNHDGQYDEMEYQHVDYERQENIRLKMELQRMQEAEGKSTDLVNRFEKSILSLRNDTSSWIYEYQSAKQNLHDSYEQRLEEEARTYNEFKLDYDSTLNAMRQLRGKLSAARDQLPSEETKIDK